MNELVVTRRAQWRILLPLGMALALSLMGDLTLYAVLPANAASMGLSLSVLGMLLSANRIVRLVSNPLAGMAMDAWGRRRLFISGLGLGSVSTLCYLAFRHLGIFLLGRLLWGISWSMIYVGAYSIVVDITETRDRGWGSGILQAFYLVGLSAGPLMGGLLTDRLGFSSGVIICALGGILGFLIALGRVPETRGVYTEGTERPGQGFPRGRPRMVSPGRLWASMRQDKDRSRILVAIAVLYLLAVAINEGIVLSTISLYVKQRSAEGSLVGNPGLGLASLGGLLFFVRGLVATAAAPLLGSLSDRAVGRSTMGLVGALGGVIGLAFLAWGSPFWALAMGMALLALSGGTLGAVLPAWLGDLARQDERASLLGALMTAGDIGSGLAPLIVYTLSGGLAIKGIYVVSSLALGVGAALFWLATSQAWARARTSRSVS